MYLNYKNYFNKENKKKNQKINVKIEIQNLMKFYIIAMKKVKNKANLIHSLNLKIKLLNFQVNKKK